MGPRSASKRNRGAAGMDALNRASSAVGPRAAAVTLDDALLGDGSGRTRLRLRYFFARSSPSPRRMIPVALLSGLLDGSSSRSSPSGVVGLAAALVRASGERVECGCSTAIQASLIAAEIGRWLSSRSGGRAAIPAIRLGRRSSLRTSGSERWTPTLAIVLGLAIDCPRLPLRRVRGHADTAHSFAIRVQAVRLASQFSYYALARRWIFPVAAISRPKSAARPPLHGPRLPVLRFAPAARLVSAGHAPAREDLHEFVAAVARTPSRAGFAVVLALFRASPGPSSTRPVPFSSSSPDGPRRASSGPLLYLDLSDRSEGLRHLKRRVERYAVRLGYARMSSGPRPRNRTLLRWKVSAASTGLAAVLRRRSLLGLAQIEGFCGARVRGVLAGRCATLRHRGTPRARGHARRPRPGRPSHDAIGTIRVLRGLGARRPA